MTGLKTKRLKIFVWLPLFAIGLNGLAGCSTMEEWTGVESPELPSFSLPKFSNPFKKPKPKLPGERIPVMVGKNEGLPDLDIGAATEIAVLPVAAVNNDWTQPGGRPDNAPGHLALSGSLSTKWQVDVGFGSSKRSRVVASPIVFNGRVFTLDSR